MIHDGVPQGLLDELDARLARLEPPVADARRLFHGRGQCFRGLEPIAVDWYEPVALVTVYSARAVPWLPGLSQHLQTRLADRLGCVLAQHRHLPRSPSQILFGALPEPAFAREAGLRFRLRLGGPRNIGFFPDMRAGRALVRSLATGRKVLNLFAYTCSFSVAALAGGAEHVVNVDMSRVALALGRDNHRHNGLDLRSAAFLGHDLFRSFGKLKTLGPYGLILVDPPSEQGRSFSARRDWPRIARRLADLTVPGSDVIACVNSPRLGPEFLSQLFELELPGWSQVSSLGAGDDFPERDPRRGLKILHVRRAG